MAVLLPPTCPNAARPPKIRGPLFRCAPPPKLLIAVKAGRDAPASAPRGPDPPAARGRRPTDRRRAGGGAPDQKGGAKAAGGGGPPPRPGRKQAKEPPQLRDTKQPAKQSQEQPSRGDRRPASP